MGRIAGGESRFLNSEIPRASTKCTFASVIPFAPICRIAYRGEGTFVTTPFSYSDFPDFCRYLVKRNRGGFIRELLKACRRDEDGQDIAEYAVMLAVILVIVIGVVRMIGSNASTVFSQVGSAIQ